MPLDGLGIDVKVWSVIGQGPPEAVEEGTQVATGLGLGGIGPELEGEVGAGLGCVAVEEEVGEEGLEAGRADAVDGRALVIEAKVAEEVDIKGWNHLQPPSAMKGNHGSRCCATIAASWDRLPGKARELQGAAMTPG